MVNLLTILYYKPISFKIKLHKYRIFYICKELQLFNKLYQNIGLAFLMSYIKVEFNCIQVISTRNY